MTLSEQVQKALAYISKIEVPKQLSPQETGRAFYEQFIPLAGAKEQVFQIEEQTLQHGHQPIPIRIYRPNDKDKLPLILYFHGGWFNAGSLDTHDTPLRQLCNLSQAIIISVAYRLAPEHPFPAGLNNGELVMSWLLENATSLRINPDQIILAGDSAGAALAATITRKFRDKILVQLLIYPVTDHTLKTSSWLEFKEGPLLDLKGGMQAWDWYLPQQDKQHYPDAVPILADDLEKLPPTFIAVAEYDPLRDEAIQYAEKLKANDVTVKLQCYQGMIHGFFQMGGYLKEAKTLMQDMVDFLKTHCSTK